MNSNTIPNSNINNIQFELFNVSTGFVSNKPLLNINYCEKDYLLSDSAQELLNFISSFSILLIGLFGIFKCEKKFDFEIQKKFVNSYKILCLNGISFSLHHLNIDKMCEIFYILTTTTLIHILLYNSITINNINSKNIINNKILKTFLIIYSLLCFLIYLYLSNIFILLLFNYIIPLFYFFCYNYYFLYYINLKPYHRRYQYKIPIKLFYKSIFNLLAGIIFWNIDLLFCNLFIFNIIYYFHSLWHIFFGIGCYYIILSQIMWDNINHNLRERNNKINMLRQFNINII